MKSPFPLTPPSAAAPRRGGLLHFGLRLGVLFLPAAVLALGTQYVPDDARPLYWAGAGLAGLFGLALLPQPRLARPGVGLAVIALYIFSQAWLWFGRGAFHQHWYPHLVVGVLLIVPILLFAAIVLVRTGAYDLRRARKAAARLLRRARWPDDPNQWPALPEVARLRDAVQTEAAPALALLADPRPEVRVCALSALAFRKTWRAGQPELVQQVAQHAPEPAVRAAAIRALAFSLDPFVVETLARSLRDPAAEVRRAAAQVLFWDSEHRWSWIRFSVNEALSDPALSHDGALPLAGVSLPPQAVADLHDWANKGGDLSVRATQTLIAYYAQVLNARANTGEVVASLRQTLLDAKAPTMLRVELGQLLFEQELLDRGTVENLLSHDNPVPLRLLAADALLIQGAHPVAADALRHIARMPNREIALAVAQIVQRRLGVDLGMDLQSPPAPQTRQAAELTRRVMQWAAEAPPDGGPATAEGGPQPPSRPETDWDMSPVPPRHGSKPRHDPDTTPW